MRRALTTSLVLAAVPGGLALTLATATGGHRLLTTGTAVGGDPAAAVAGLVSLLTALLAGWLTAVLLLSLLAALPGELGRRATAVRDRVTPALVRRWAAIALGASVTATVLPGTAVAAAVRTTDGETPEPGWRPASTPTSAASAPTAPTTAPVPAPTPSTSSATTSAPTDLPGPGWGGRGAGTTSAPVDTATTAPTATPRPGWTPRRPPARQRTDPHLLTGRHRADSIHEVTVRRGDTLWSIAAARLGPEANDHEIAAAWPRWHAANRAVIGPDPHVLLPGTLITPPTDHPGDLPATKGTP